MARTSNRELARRLGVSETAVRRAEKAGRIRREADGSWDPAKVQAAWSDSTDQAQQRPARSGKPAVKRRALKPVPEAALGAVRDTLREHGEPVAAGVMTFMQARTANEVLKAQERRLRLQQMKGELVDRARAVAQVFRLAREERDAWVNWPARVAAMMAAELSASCSGAAGGAIQVDQHRLHTVLERHVREHLTELAEVRPSLR
jgi:DNA-binding Lrp family transcriptional regulator